MRARVRVGEISRRSTGATRSGLIGKSRLSSWSRAGRQALAGLQFEQLLGIDADRIGLDRRRGGDRAGDDLALRHQAFDARVDQPVAELVEVEDADDQHAERGKVEKQDAPRQARKDVVAQGSGAAGPSARTGKPSEGAATPFARVAGFLISASMAIDRSFPGETYASRNRYPTPYSVSIMSKSSSTALNFLRRRLIWLSMVRSST